MNAEGQFSKYVQTMRFIRIDTVSYTKIIMHKFRDEAGVLSQWNSLLTLCLCSSECPKTTVKFEMKFMLELPSTQLPGY